MTLEPKNPGTPAFGKAGEFQAFYHQCKDWGWRRAYSILLNEADASDALQEAFVKAYRERGRFGPPHSLTSWFGNIVNHCAIDLLRKNKSQRNRIFGKAGELASSSKKSAGAPEQDRLPQALLRLPEEARLMLTLFEVQEMQQKEIAELLNCSLAKVQTTLHRARKQLRDYLLDGENAGG